MAETAMMFGRNVLGPIYGEFALRLWTYVSSLDKREETTLLFCTRGGLRLQLIYNAFLAASGLASPVHTDALMVSRVIAVRPALLAGSPSAYEQLDYEFPSSLSLLDVARAVARISAFDGDSDPRWRKPYSRTPFSAILNTPLAAPVIDEIRRQNVFFRRHLAEVSGGRPNIVLCDTGLFGSTVQLLQDGIPEISWSAAMFARSNYKKLQVPHFDRTVGLCGEADLYCPWRPRSVLRRYWHLIEDTLEPELKSVNRFEEGLDGPVSNLEVKGWRDRIPPQNGEILAGVMDYMEGLPRLSAAARVVAEAPEAWRALQRAFVWPTADEGHALQVGLRSADFGVDRVNSARPWRGPLAAMRGYSVWREGEIARSAGLLRLPMLGALEGAYGLQWIKRRFL